MGTFPRLGNHYVSIVVHVRKQRWKVVLGGYQGPRSHSSVPSSVHTGAPITVCKCASARGDRSAVAGGAT